MVQPPPMRSGLFAIFHRNRAKLNQLDQKGIDYNAGHGAAAASSQIMHHSSRSRIQPFQSAPSLESLQMAWLLEGVVGWMFEVVAEAEEVE